MSTAKRNLWILVTVSALALVAQDWFQGRSFSNESKSRCYTETTCTSSLYSQEYRSCNKATRKSCSMTLMSTEPDINEFIAVDVIPEPLNMETISARISYPDQARQDGVEGMVTVRVLVDEEGQYVKHEVLRSVHPDLIMEVEHHLPDLTFSPAIQDGQQVKFWMNVPFNFQLETP